MREAACRSATPEPPRYFATDVITFRHARRRCYARCRLIDGATPPSLRRPSGCCRQAFCLPPISLRRLRACVFSEPRSMRRVLDILSSPLFFALRLFSSLLMLRQAASIFALMLCHAAISLRHACRYAVAFAFDAAYAARRCRHELMLIFLPSRHHFLRFVIC